jgi:ubiquinone/menaquinone biosynthesis C-methylase UbiE/uncharacterized protein YbaR (Trm112 family)
MNNIERLKTIKEFYEQGGNVINFLKNTNHNFAKNDIEAILISYDFQAGSYIKSVKENPDYIENYTSLLADILNTLEGESLLEVGVGEATTLINLIPKLKISFDNFYGFDLSWSRIKYAQKYAKDKQPNKNIFLSTGNLFCSPYADNSIDIVYTSHSIEPNGGRELDALKEIYRIAKNYVVLLEPCFELANEAAQNRMLSNGYVTNLYDTAKQLGYEILEYRLWDLASNPLNPTGLMIIRKNGNKETVNDILACPITKSPMKLLKGSYYVEHSSLVYPVIDEVPCLLPENAIIATHFNDF